jgi:hypothetical protein
MEILPYEETAVGVTSIHGYPWLAAIRARTRMASGPVPVVFCNVAQVAGAFGTSLPTTVKKWVRTGAAG